MMKRLLVPAVLFTMVAGGCTDMPQLGGGPTYGDTAGSVSSQNERSGNRYPEFRWPSAHDFPALINPAG